MKGVKTLPGADIVSDGNILVAKFCTKLKKIIKFQKSRTRWDMEKLYTDRQRVQGTLEENFGLIECESGNAEVQWNSIKKYVLILLVIWLGKSRRDHENHGLHRKRLVKWMNEGNGRMLTLKKVYNYRRLRNDLKRATENAKKEYFENIREEIMEFQRTGRYDLMYMKKKELDWNETQGMQNNGIEDSQGIRIVGQTQVLKILENYITDLYDSPNRPETLEVEPEEEVDTDRKGPYILQSEVGRAIKEMKNKKGYRR